METEPHPRWPKKEPETLPELQEYLRSRFDFLLADPKHIEEIRNVLTWLQSDSPELLRWDGGGSFSTLFLPFHTGSPFMQTALKRFVFSDALRGFLDVCTALESTTDQFAYIQSLDELQHKDTIMENLHRLLDLLPTASGFQLWVSAIRESTGKG